MTNTNNKKLIISQLLFLGVICPKSCLKQLFGQYLVQLKDYMLIKEKRNLIIIKIGEKYHMKPDKTRIKDEINIHWKNSNSIET